MKVGVRFDRVASRALVGISRATVAVAERSRNKARRILIAGSEVRRSPVIAVRDEIVRYPGVVGR